MPAEIVTGALRAREELGVEVLLVGDPSKSKLPAATDSFGAAGNRSI